MARVASSRERDRLSRVVLTAIITGLLILCMSSPAFAAGGTYTSGYYEYVIEDESVAITGYFGTAESIEIPSSIAGYPVSTIKKGAFTEAKDLKTIFLPETIMTVEEGAFRQDQRAIHPKSIEAGDAAGNTSGGSAGDATGNAAGTAEGDSAGGSGGTVGNKTGTGSQTGQTEDSFNGTGTGSEDATMNDMEDGAEADLSDLEDGSEQESKPDRIPGMLVIAAVLLAALVIIMRKRSTSSRDQ